MHALEGYDLSDRLHESSKTLVYRATETATRAPVILTLSRETHASLITRARYRQEFELTRALPTERVLKPRALRELGGRVALVFDDVGGTSLDKLIRERRLGVEEVIAVAVQVLEALTPVHAASVVHCDVKPANILVAPASLATWLIDFRSSLPSPSSGASPPSEGTFAYFAPEQTGRTHRSLDHRADLYALGVTLYELLTGQVPFPSPEAFEVIFGHVAGRVVPPHKVVPSVPSALSDVVMKLLEKDPERRYLSAQGVLADLERCRKIVARDAESSESFALAKDDVPIRFALPPKMYGRADAVAALRTAFEEALREGGRLVLVTGYSGIGKTSLVQELDRDLAQHRGYFVSGKFEQFQRNVPLTALGRAFGGLVAQLLCESDRRVAEWRDKLLAALGQNARALFEVIPELELLLGSQPEIPVLGPVEAQNRFNLTFERFLDVVAHPSHPVAVFLDDLQWVDSASLQVLGALISNEARRGLLVVGALRDQEVTASHPLTPFLAELRGRRTRAWTEIALNPLGRAEVVELLSDALRRDGSEVAALAELVLEKTDGNPFYIGQFLRSLETRGIITYSARDRGWVWDAEDIRRASVTENVAELLVTRVEELDEEGRRLLHLAACLGARFKLQTLAGIVEAGELATHRGLGSAISAGLVAPTSKLEVLETAEGAVLVPREFGFLHDRIQEAAYQLEPEARRKVSHLRIGQHLRKNAPAEGRSALLFEMLDHLNEAWELLTDPAERRQLAQLDLEAAQRAKSAGAYAAAASYCKVGLEVAPGGWDEDHALRFGLGRELAENFYLLGALEDSLAVLDELDRHARTPLERGELAKLRAWEYTLQTRHGEVLATTTQGVNALGISLPDPSADLTVAIAAERAVAEARLGTRAIAELIHLPTMSHPEVHMAMRLLAGAQPSAYMTNQPFYQLINTRLVNLSLEHGNCPESSSGYGTFAIQVGPIQGEYRRGFELGMLAWDLSNRYGNLSQKCRDGVHVGSFLAPWVRPLRESFVFFDEGHRAGLDAGELQWAGYNLHFKALALFHAGEQLPRLLELYSEYRSFLAETRNAVATSFVDAMEMCVRNLMGLTDDERVFSLPKTSSERWLAENGAQRTQVAIFFVGMEQALYLNGELEDALRVSDQAEEMLAYMPGLISNAAHALFRALTLSARLAERTGEARAELRGAIEICRARVERWAELCPENFASMRDILRAEDALGEGRRWEAVALYDDAADRARAEGFVQLEALAAERAGVALHDAGKVEAASGFLRRARDAYEAWGARRKVEALAARYPALLARWRPAGDTTAWSSTTSTAASLDLSAMLKASQAISREVEQSALASRLLEVCLASGGAESAVLLLRGPGGLSVAARASVDARPTIGSERLEDSQEVSRAVVQVVARRVSPLVVESVGRDSVFGRDPDLVRLGAKSVLAVPIVRGGEVGGVLYLQHSNMTHAFPPERARLVGVLAAQAGISLENAQLIAELRAKNQELTAALDHLLERSRLGPQASSAPRFGEG